MTALPLLLLAAALIVPAAKPHRRLGPPDGRVNPKNPRDGPAEQPDRFRLAGESTCSPP